MKYEATVRATFVFTFEDDGDLVLFDQAHELAKHSIISGEEPDDIEVMSVVATQETTP